MSGEGKRKAETGKRAEDAWIQTWSGRQFFIERPDPDVIDPYDIAAALSKKCRFSGHVKYFYSVAQHSLHVCELTMKAAAGLPPEDCERLGIAALLHDAHEAYSGFGDIVAPAKHLAPVLEQIERNIDIAVGQRFGFAGAIMNDKRVKHADRVALATEKRDLMTDCPFAWRELPPPDSRIIRPEQEIFVRDQFLKMLFSFRGAMNFREVTP